MPYATAANLLDRFGAEEIAQRTDRSTPRLVTGDLLQAAAAGADLSAWTAEEQAAAAAALALVDQAIADADSEIDGYVATRYSVPVTPVPPIIQRLACDLARYVLYDDQATDGVQKRRDGAVTVLRDISAGRVSLGAPGTAQEPKGGLVEVNNPTKVFSRPPNGGLR